MGEELRDADGVRLLFKEQVAALAGVKPATINSYAAESRRQRRSQHRSVPGLLPREVRKVRRTLVKSNGQPVVVVSPVWREPEIIEWVRERARSVSVPPAA